MKNRIISTVGLLAVSAVAVTFAVRSYGRIDDKLNLDTSTQTTMQMKETSTMEESQEKIQDTENQPETDMSEEPEVIEEPKVTEEPEVTEEPVEINPEAPVLTLKNDEVKITVGETFNVVNQVEEITDDKDSRWRLFRNIEVFGEYDTNTPGKYTLKYVVTDSDRNGSMPKKLKLIVVEE